MVCTLLNDLVEDKEVKVKIVMNEDCGFIKIHRKILEWGWYKEINTKVLLVHMFLRANWKDGKFKGTTVPRGSFVSSISKLAEETGLTNDEVRTAISHLVSTGRLPSRAQTNIQYIRWSTMLCIKMLPSRKPIKSQATPFLFPNHSQQ